MLTTLATINDELRLCKVKCFKKYEYLYFIYYWGSNDVRQLLKAREPF